VVGADPETVADVAGRRLGFPAVVKQRRSRMGVGVMKCESRDHLDAVLDSLWRVGDELLVQQYVETGGCSIRCFVVGSEVVATARFCAGGNEWRSNAARGGRVEACSPDGRMTELAVAAAEAVGLGVCGVDLLPAAGGFMVCELNPTPGFMSLEAATGIDVATAIIEHLVGCGN
jgi:RimK family alpha-L-glutamate ligase